jgi:hypothetical protein
VRERIGAAALRVGRRADEVRLVAVSKTFPSWAVLAAWEAGQREFGESRPREGVEKVVSVAELLEVEGVAERPTWHMIGHVQSRKARYVVEHFDLTHSVDRLSLAEKLHARAEEGGRALPILLQCNVSGEESKYGFDLAGWEEDEGVRERFFTQVERILALPTLRPEGLMTMAPFVDDAETVRPVFASLRGLLTTLQSRFPDVAWRHLSMGMTDDFEVAVEEGSTMVRIGRAIFGERR